MKYRILVLTLAVFVFVGCSNKKCKMQFTTQEIASWTQWFEDNKKYYVHLSFGNDSVSTNQNDAIDDLLSLFYNGNDSLRHNYRMILWRLNEFYPIDNDGDCGYEAYLNLKKQVDSLLNFKTTLDYRLRHKSALTRLMYVFQIKMYEDKLASLLHGKSAILFEQEKAAWKKYYEATSEAFGINILRKESYYLKYTFWNNYDFDIMNQRLKSLLYMYHRDHSIFSETESGNWEKVESAYNKLKGELDPNKNPHYDYSYSEKVEALTMDEEAFKEYLNKHDSLLNVLRISDKAYQLYMKEQTLIHFHTYDHIERIGR